MSEKLKPHWVGSGLSAFLHGGIILAIVTAGVPQEETRKLYIDFRLETARPIASPVEPDTQPQPKAKPPQAPPEPLRPAKATKSIPREESLRPLNTANESQQTPAPDLLPQPATASAPQPESPTEETTSTNARQVTTLPAANNDTDNASGRQSSSSVEVGAKDKEAAPPEELYQRQNFNFIREDLQGKIRYPVVARRNGWEGRVVVSFTVCRDGSVTNAKIIESSGFPALDNSALATIREAGPLPLPPVKAELVIPIVFKLS